MSGKCEAHIKGGRDQDGGFLVKKAFLCRVRGEDV